VSSSSRCFSFGGGFDGMVGEGKKDVIEAWLSQIDAGGLDALLHEKKKNKNLL
jgi:hypothetical protein